MGATTLLRQHQVRKSGRRYPSVQIIAVDYTDPNWRQELRALTGEQGLNVYDPVGGDKAEPAFRSLAPGGRFLVVGFAAGEIKDPLNPATAQTLGHCRCRLGWRNARQPCH